MATKRTRISRPRSAMPLWAERLLEGVAPDRGTDDWTAFLGWYFFGGEIAGLPPWDTDEGRALIAALPDETWTATGRAGRKCPPR